MSDNAGTFAWAILFGLALVYAVSLAKAHAECIPGSASWWAPFADRVVCVDDAGNRWVR